MESLIFPPFCYLLRSKLLVSSSTPLSFWSPSIWSVGFLFKIKPEFNHLDAQATLIFCLDCYASLLTGLPLSTLGHLESVLNTKARMIDPNPASLAAWSTLSSVMQCSHFRRTGEELEAPKVEWLSRGTLYPGGQCLSRGGRGGSSSRRHPAVSGALPAVSAAMS